MSLATDTQRDAPNERSSEGWEGGIYGACPLQGEGTVNGRHWYFRARGDDWSFAVYRGEVLETELLWSANGPYEGVASTAGWMHYSEAWEIIASCIEMAREQNFTMGDLSASYFERSRDA